MKHHTRPFFGVGVGGVGVWSDIGGWRKKPVRAEERQPPPPPPHGEEKVFDVCIDISLFMLYNINKRNNKKKGVCL